MPVSDFDPLIRLNFQRVWPWTAAFMAALVYSLYALFQPVYTYDLLDPRFDAHQYKAAYDFFAGHAATFQVGFPFNTRVLVPWLASRMPFDDIVENFLVLNGIFMVLTIGFLVRIWQRLGISWVIQFGALLWIFFHWKGLVRMYLPDPITADVAGHFLMTLWLFQLTSFLPKSGDSDSLHLPKTINIFWLFFIAFLGVLQKESFIVLIFFYFVIKFNVDKKRQNWLNLSLFVLSLVLYFLLFKIFPPLSPDWRNNPLVSVFRGLNRYISQPQLFLRLPVSWLFAYGFWIVALFEKNRWDYLRLMAFVWLGLSIVGGGDTVRIFYNGMPFVLTYLLTVLNHKSERETSFLLIASIPLMRVSELEPDLGKFPNQMHDWCVECWTGRESMGYFLYGLLVLASYYYFFRRNALRRSKP
ncbi:MAG: hypothetical protein ACK4GN_10210 [Runella sp.]